MARLKFQDEHQPFQEKNQQITRCMSSLPMRRDVKFGPGLRASGKARQCQVETIHLSVFRYHLTGHQVPLIRLRRLPLSANLFDAYMIALRTP